MKRLLVFLALICATPSIAAEQQTIEVQTFKNIAANTASFTLRGGNYGVTVHATFGGGNVALQRLAADGLSWVNVITAFTADGFAASNLPNGTYRIGVTTATGVYIDVTAVLNTL